MARKKQKRRPLSYVSEPGFSGFYDYPDIEPLIALIF
jgi:hypothetical protein